MSKSRPEKTSLLASGKEKSWKKKYKPRLAADVDDTGLPMPEDDDDDTIKTSVSMFFRLAGGLASIAVFLLIIGWFILGVTILPFVRIGDTVWVTKWAAYPEGAVPQGTMIVASDGPVQRSFVDRLNLILLNHPEYSTSVVVAGPGLGISVDPETKEILWRDQPTGFSSDEVFQEFDLQAEYLTICIEGDCGEPGDYFLTPMRNVIGEATNIYSFPFSLQELPEYPLEGKILAVVGETNIVEEQVLPEDSEEVLVEETSSVEDGEGEIVE